jgi:hypothetical protein
MVSRSQPEQQMGIYSSDKLPADFAKIPKDLQKIMYWQVWPEQIAAEEAVMDAQIPQTAKVIS